MGKVIIALGGGGGLDTDECTAGRPQVLSGYTAGVRGEDDPAPGSMPEKGAWNGTVAMNGSVTIPEGHHNGQGKVSGPSVTQRGAVSAALNCGGSYTVPEGYHNGAGKITANSLAGQTSGNAGASDIISGRTAWVNGARVTGNMADYRSMPTAIDAIRLNNNRFEVAVKAGCHGYNWAGNGYEYMSYAQVAGAIGLSAGVIKKGVRIMNLTGTFEGWVPVATDLYLRGNNPAGFTANRATFESGAIYSNTTYTGSRPIICTSKSYNLSGYSRLNVEINITGYLSSVKKISMELYACPSRNTNDDAVNDPSCIKIGGYRADTSATGTITISFDISSVNYTKYIRLETVWNSWQIYHIWLS